MAKRKSIELQKPAAIQLFWRWHTSNEFGPRRVWRSDWAFDQFEIIDAGEFNGLLVWMIRFGFEVTEVFDED